MTRKISFIYLLFAVIYLFSLSFNPLPISWLIKALPIILLASVVITFSAGRERIIDRKSVV